jgi:FixJ family two-component response regulator
VTDSTGLVYVVEDDAFLAAFLTRLIESAGLDVELFGSATEFLAHARAVEPCCLLLDVALPDQNGLELQRTLALADDQMPIIFMSGYCDISISIRAMKAGAVEFLIKPFTEGEVLQAIQHALDRRRRRLRQQREITDIRARAASLTNRERQVMGGIVMGKLSKQVAADLGLSELTVKVHRRHIMRKMAAPSFAELVRMVGRIS